MMNICDELLSAAIERGRTKLDEQLYFDLFQAPIKAKTAGKKRDVTEAVGSRKAAP
jgi:hypothetical protein